MGHEMEHEDCDCGESRHGGYKQMHMHMHMGLMPLLLIPFGIMMMRGMARHKMGRMGMMHRAEWKNGVPPMFAEMHRRAHAAEAAEEAEKKAETEM
jgi:hypothetical protein